MTKTYGAYAQDKRAAEADARYEARKRVAEIIADTITGTKLDELLEALDTIRRTGMANAIRWRLIGPMQPKPLSDSQLTARLAIDEARRALDKAMRALEERDGDVVMRDDVRRALDEERRR